MALDPRLDQKVSMQAEKILAKRRQIRQLNKTWVFQGKWLRAGTLQYTAPDGRNRVWETTERCTRTGPTDGVDILGNL